MLSGNINGKFQFFPSFFKNSNLRGSKLEDKSAKISPDIPQVQETSTTSKINIQQETKSKFAYATLIHGIDDTFNYRGFLFNAMISHSKLKSFGSTADFIVMLGFSNNYFSNNREPFEKDFQMLQRAGIKLYFLERFLEKDSINQEKISFAEMALLKISPWSFKEYERVQYFDGDVMIKEPMDCFFQLESNTWNSGNASPLNSGWFLAIPDQTTFEEMKALAIQRLSYPWNEDRGWGAPIPQGVTFRGGKKLVSKWDFNGASLDQGLFFYEFLMNLGNIILLDEESARWLKDGQVFEPDPRAQSFSLDSVLNACDGQLPTWKFFHFTGRSKPWLATPEELAKSSNKGLKLWAEELDKLGIEGVNHQTITSLQLKPPLGYFYPNK